MSENKKPERLEEGQLAKWFGPRKIQHQTVVIDNYLFDGVEFVECNLVYYGGSAYFDDCRFTDCDFGFLGSANKTLNFIRGLRDMGLDMLEAEQVEEAGGSTDG